LPSKTPSNAQSQSDLALLYWVTGSAWANAEPKSKNEARAMVEKGRDIFRQLKERSGLSAREQHLLLLIELQLDTQETK
jgi:hypothetical protein